jgi:hypothetical protein
VLPLEVDKEVEIDGPKFCEHLWKNSFEIERKVRKNSMKMRFPNPLGNLPELFVRMPENLGAVFGSSLMKLSCLKSSQFSVGRTGSRTFQMDSYWKYRHRHMGCQEAP